MGGRPVRPIPIWTIGIRELRAPMVVCTLVRSMPSRPKPRRFAPLLFMIVLACSPAPPHQGTEEGADKITVPTPEIPPRLGPTTPEPTRPAPATQTPTPRGIRLHARTEFKVPGKPEWVCAADLNRDGHDDLLATAQAPGAVHMFLGSRNGLLTRPITQAIGSYPLRPMVVNTAADQPPVLAIPLRGTPGLLWLDPTAPEGERQVAHMDLPSCPRAAVAADIDGDGSSEILLALDGPELVLVQGHSIVQSLALEAELPRCLALTPQAAFVGSQSMRSVDRFAIQDGRLTPGPTTFMVGGIPRALQLADVDGDGDSELVVAAGDHEVRVLGLTTPGGPLALNPQHPARTLQLTSAIPIDLLANAHAGELGSHGVDRPPGGEMIAISYATMVFSLVGLDPEGQLLVHDQGYVGQTPTSATWIDLDGDDLLDLAVANRDAMAVSLLHRAGPASYHQAQRVPVPGFPSELAAGDLDGDGADEVLLVSAKGEKLTVLERKSGPLRPLVEIGTGPAPHGLHVHDFDGDGLLDAGILTTDTRGCHLERLFGAGDGSLHTDPLAPPIKVGMGNCDWLMVDVESDGREELLVLVPEAQELHLYQSTGRDTLSRIHTESFALSPAAMAWLPSSAAGPGELAVCFVQKTQGVLVVGRFTEDNRGTLTFTERARHELTIVPQQIRVADVDGNGHQDCIILGLARPGGTEGRVLPVMQLMAKGELHLRHWMVLETSHLPRDLEVADLNGDGLAEVLVASQHGHIVDRWSGMHNRAGSFRFKREAGIGSGVGVMAVQAIDGGGGDNPDLAVADGNANQVSLIRIVSR